MKARFCAFLLLAAVVGVREASATSIGLSLVNGANSVTILQNGTVTTTGAVSLFSAPVANGNLISFAGSIGSWLVNVTTGLSSNSMGSPGVIDLNSVNVASSAASGALTMTFSQMNNPVSFPGWNLTMGGTSSNMTSVAYSAYVSATNTLFGTPASGLIGQLAFTTSPFAGSTTGMVAGTALYALTQVVTLTPGAFSASFSGNATLTPVPEPASLTILGVGLSGLAVLTRRHWRRGRKQSPKTDVL
jgi:hypothetical protein